MSERRVTVWVNHTAIERLVPPGLSLADGSAGAELVAVRIADSRWRLLDREIVLAFDPGARRKVERYLRHAGVLWRTRSVLWLVIAVVWLAALLARLLGEPGWTLWLVGAQLLVTLVLTGVGLAVHRSLVPRQAPVRSLDGQVRLRKVHPAAYEDWAARNPGLIQKY